MANIIKQSVNQINQTSIPKRLIVQYFDDATEEDKQVVINYDDLTTEEKATFDAYQVLCESKMI